MCCGKLDATKIVRILATTRKYQGMDGRDRFLVIEPNYSLALETESDALENFHNAGPHHVVNLTPRYGDCAVRFVQIAVCDELCLVDLPITVITPHEAAELLSRRTGFDYPNHGGLDLRTKSFQPIQKEYRLGEEPELVVDVLFIFAQLWHLPIDSTEYRISCGSF